MQAFLSLKTLAHEHVQAPQFRDLEYPPVSISSSVYPYMLEYGYWKSSIIGQGQGDGDYYVRGSSLYSDDDVYAHWRLFDDTTDPSYPCAHWISGNYYNGEWVIGASEQYSLDNNYFGDWVTVKLPEAIKLTKTIFVMKQLENAPRLFRIYGSHNCSEWTFLYSQEVSIEYDANGMAEIAIASMDYYSCYGLVVSAVQSGSALNFARWKLLATEEVSGVLYCSSFFCVCFVFTYHTDIFKHRCHLSKSTHPFQLSQVANQTRLLGRSGQPTLLVNNMEMASIQSKAPLCMINTTTNIGGYSALPQKDSLRVHNGPRAIIFMVNGIRAHHCSIPWMALTLVTGLPYSFLRLSGLPKQSLLRGRAMIMQPRVCSGYMDRRTAATGSLSMHKRALRSTTQVELV
jgi:hypothetical protein